MEIHERFGRLAEKYEMECEAHLKTICLLQHLVKGTVKVEQLEVTENSWTVKPLADTPTANQ